MQSNALQRKPQEELFFANNVKMFDFAMMHFSDKVVNLDNIFKSFLDNKDVTYIVKGSTRILAFLEENSILDNNAQSLLEWGTQYDVDLFFKKIKDGIFYDKLKFDQALHSKMDLPMLNKNALIGDFSMMKSRVFDQDMFVKPTSDGKSFAGKILPKGQSLEEMIKTIKHQSSVVDEQIMFAPIKKVLNEFRFFVVDSEVVTGSQYMDSGVVSVRPLIDYDTDKKAMKVAKEYAQLYHPSDVFTLDVCLEDSGQWSIVEYNCFNCSGLYSSNLFDLIKSLDNFFVKKTTGFKFKNKN